MAEIYCHGKTLLNALRAVWLEVGKALFGQATTGRKTLAAWMLGARRPATMTAPSAGNRGTVEQRRRCPPEVASLLGGIGAIR